MTVPLTTRPMAGESSPAALAHAPGRQTRLHPRQTQERRGHSRVKLELFGRLMLADQSEHECVTVNMSPGGVLLKTSGRGNIGEQVIIYFDKIGRFEGEIIRVLPNGIALAFNVTPRRREKLATHLTWLANHKSMNLPEDRRHERFVPENPFVKIIRANGEEHMCRFLDLSQSGAALASAARPQLGEELGIGQIRGRVVRTMDEGFALEFAVVADPQLLRTLLSERKTN